jgi:hypothetical protein
MYKLTLRHFSSVYKLTRPEEALPVMKWAT